MIVKLAAKQKRLMIYLMTAMFFMGMAATDIYLSSLPQMVLDLHSSAFGVNLTLSAYNLSIAVSVLFVGELSNRFGRRSLILVGLAAFTLASAFIAFTPYLCLIIAFRLIQAFGCAVIIIVPRLILHDCMEEQEQIAANGTLLIGLTISPAVAPVIGAYLAKLWGWEACFAFSAISGATLFVLAYYIIPETKLEKLKEFKPLKQYVATYAQILTDRVFISLTTTYSCAVAAYFAFLGISSYLYISDWHIPPHIYALLFIWLAVAYLLGNQLMLWLNRWHFSVVKIIRVGVYSTLIGALIVASSLLFTNNLIQLILVSFGVLFMRAANALINPPSQTRLMMHFAPNSAQALGLSMCISFALMACSINVVTLLGINYLLSLILVLGTFVLVAVGSFVKNQKLLRSS